MSEAVSEPCVDDEDTSITTPEPVTPRYESDGSDGADFAPDGHFPIPQRYARQLRSKADLRRHEDRVIKTWDGDKFEQIQKLKGHQGEIWAMAISRTGDFLATASHDKSIRIWSRTDEPIFLEEERERELEELYENTLAANLEDEEPLDGEPAEAVAASKQTISTLTAGERIAEALELGLADLELVRDWEAQKRKNPRS